ncbi:NAD dependent epimerase/dehydratase family protein [Pseudomonas sp. GM18]|uniref:NAD-dependent epimerase/dehydratase family protein n=1 Tax=Pseudomonas sp. GM18 TaxID=1144324 RepID=UPI00027260CF|nr:NAD-dependent epimerase/dehydratase family protein [Pseudomonas sp. GM18]EJM14033.1 NAD dependent epimerase/dehydratase family protein [Pseudomonas sp. GM18]
MNIAILGANSHIAKDLVASFANSTGYHCQLFLREVAALDSDIRRIAERKSYPVLDYSSFSVDSCFDAIINFVGVGDPARAKMMGAQIFEVTEQYDQLALSYLKQHPSCKYIFLSSGAAYGSSFEEPVGEGTKALFPINNLQSQDWYSIAKFYAECRHRAMPDLNVVDVRVFGYFSHRQSIDARFFLSDILRAIKSNQVLGVSPENMVRDYLAPADFFQLVKKILSAPPANDVVDCYTLEPIDKFSLLSSIKHEFGLQFEVVGDSAKLNATGAKSNYYSLNRNAEKFGYMPVESSLSGVLSEIELYLGNDAVREVRL